MTLANYNKKNKKIKKKEKLIIISFKNLLLITKHLKLFKYILFFQF